MARSWTEVDWQAEVNGAVGFRPDRSLGSTTEPEGIHPMEVAATLHRVLTRAGTSILVGDGGEFGQWMRGYVTADHRLVNGPSGSIGGGVPMGIGAALAVPGARVAVVIGDGAFGFHALEFDTAIRYDIPFVTIVGNDAGWNAERVLQRRAYGADRMVGCDLLPTRYDQLVASLGGHGEHVDRIEDLEPALERAFASAIPACVDIRIQARPAPSMDRATG